MKRALAKINYVAMLSVTPEENRVFCPSWDGLNEITRSACEAGATAVLLHALDVIAKAGVSLESAAKQLREGRTLEEICEPREEPLKTAVCLNCGREGKYVPDFNDGEWWHFDNGGKACPAPGMDGLCRGATLSTRFEPAPLVEGADPGFDAGQYPHPKEECKAVY